MIGFVKDLMAFVSLSGFTVMAVTWMDVLARVA
jgi:hypothetical protein